MTQMNQPTENQGSGTSRTGARTLGNKCAVVFGAGGSLGAAVAKEFACRRVHGPPDDDRKGCVANRNGKQRFSPIRTTSRSTSGDILGRPG